MLTHHPVPVLPHKDQEALLTVGRWVQRFQFDWLRVLIGAAAVFHLGIFSALAFAPVDQIYNAGTAPVYAIANRYVWACAFLAAGVAATSLLRWQTALVQILTWFTVLPLGGLWWTAFLLAVVGGRGSAIGVVVWLVLYGLFAVAAARLALGKR